MLAKTTGNVGLCVAASKTILIDGKQSHKNQAITFLHEVLHAIWPHAVVGAKKEEVLIEALDAPLYILLQKNRLLRPGGTRAK